MGNVLDLSAVFDRDTVKMPDGTEYELRNQQEFGILDDHHLRTLIDKITSLNAVAESEDDAVKAAALLQELAAMLVVDLSVDVPDWASVQIFQFWVARAQGEAPADPPKPRRTTAASSRGSKRSTAATRKPGSKSRRTS
jgi:hypothetical protein